MDSVMLRLWMSLSFKHNFKLRTYYCGHILCLLFLMLEQMFSFFFKLYLANFRWILTTNAFEFDERRRRNI